MTCPKITNCEIEGLFWRAIERTNDANKYSALADSLPIIRHTICDNSDYKQCPIYQKEFSSEKQGNPFDSYEQTNAYEIAKANGVFDIDSKEGGQ